MRYIALLWIGLLTATAASPVAAQVADMRGFGRVQVSMLPGGQGERFDCDSAQHAVLFIHKLARDMAASATAPSEWTDIVIAERNAPVLVRPGLGAFLVFARGATAYCLTSTLSGAQAASPASFPAAQTLIRDAVLYDPSYRYPMYLDKWSTAGIGSWYPYPVNDRWTQGHANTIDEHFEFARKYGLTIQPRNGHAALEDLLPKIHEYGLPYHFALWMEWSPSLAMLDPDDLIGPSSLFTYASGYYGQVSTGSKKLEQYQIWDWLQSVKDLVDDPNLVDWLDPNGEVGTISKVTNWDYSENNRANFAHWLRQVKGYTLPGLSGAWYGDTKRFNAWDRVPIPRGYDFYGYKPGDLLADKTWHIHTGTLQAGLALGYQKAAMADATWVKFQMPGGEVPAIEWRASTSTWYRGAFDVPKCVPWSSAA